MNRTTWKYFLSILLISLFTFSSCNFLGENLQESETNSESRGVKICLNFGSSRQIMPSNYLVAEYNLRGTFNSKETVWTYDSLSKLHSATLYLNYGEWSFTLEAYANSKLIASDTISRTISDTTNTLTFEYKVSELNYSAGSGNISVSVSFPIDKKVSSVTAALYTTENLTTPISNTSTTYTTFTTDNATRNYIVNYTKDAVSSGSYYLIFKFYQNNIEDSIGIWRDLVCVANGCLSSGESTVTEFNELYFINYHLNGISFKSSYVVPASFNKSQSITLPTAENMDQTNLSFTGWYETADFSGDRITNWTYDSKTADVNLYAKNTAIVAFNMNNYGTQIESQTVLYGSKPSEPTKPESNTMFFKGWFTDEALTQKYNFNSVLTANKVLYAKWVDLPSYWSWTYPTSTPTLTWEGKGTQAEPYIIMNAQELADLAYMVNNFTTYSGTYFVLGTDIELNYGKTVTGVDDTLNNWIPIGNTTSNFAGNFDGNGKKIKGLYINDNSLENVGLFGIGKAPNNLTIDSGYVTANATYAGGVIGYSKSAIENCINKVAMNNSKVDSYLGGIAGYGSTFKNCENTGVLSGLNVAGIAGQGSVFDKCINKGEISATGKTCGGIASNRSSGSTSLEIKDCVNTTNLSSQGDYAGGLFGYFSYDFSVGNSYDNRNISIIITNSSNFGKITGLKYIGGIISYVSSEVTGSDKYNRTVSNIIISNITSTGDIETQNGTSIGGICGYINLIGHKTRNNIIKNCVYDASIRFSDSDINSYLGGICGNMYGIEILNSFAAGIIENSSSHNTIGGIVGSRKISSAIKNCYARMKMTSTVNISLNGIGGSGLLNCFYVAGIGATRATGSSYETSIGAVTSATDSVFPVNNSTLLYNGTLCEVLNAYRIDNDTDNSYKEWVVGSDGWPTFAE
ncbi:hypothetical protein DYE50_01935 [Treponema ruminis]|uniref:Uncharacterized protein n=1 Tax=Treponema ruminis TaxID=744515 RepID=A0A7W8GAN3_9SPIR|nr:InlB B-repeat-containing protein [Treponema ruminis]MBB5226916.1 hypothetical protein [Treponema ruminis]QSI01343.1 hypothetical protein DYE50_01935 [Treponema ruminis]